ncbi:hypothetical protein BC828DRAFT_269118 [Blastocladiella britannica]|nr:hypothetical protein BC828DRAFT_269118 [Blastocladiella britannica]
MHALTHVANSVLADLGVDQPMPPLRCLLLPVFLEFAGLWCAIRQIDGDPAFEFPPAGTLHNTKFMVGNPKTIGTHLVKSATLQLFTPFPATPSVSIMLCGKIVLLVGRGSNYCIPVQVSSPSLTLVKRPIVKKCHVIDDIDTVLGLFNDRLAAIVPVRDDEIDIFRDLAVPTALAGDRAIWERRMDLANGTLTALILVQEPIGTAGLDLLQRALAQPQQRLTKLDLY